MKRSTRSRPARGHPISPAPDAPLGWRKALIDRFVAAQRRHHEWINFAEIADWCAREDRSIEPNERKRAAAFGRLANDLLAGGFEEIGRSRVLYLHPRSTRARMTREWLRDAIEHNYDGDGGRSGFLPHCWIPRHLFERWLAKNRLPESPSRFEPIGDEAPAAVRLDAAQISRTGAAGRPSAKHLVKDELERRASNGEIPANAKISQIAEELADWYESGPRKRLPDLPPFKAETIRKSLGAAIRKARADAGRN